MTGSVNTDCLLLFSNLNSSQNAQTVNLKKKNYYNEQSFQEKISTWAGDDCIPSIFHMNTRSLVKHFNEIQILLQHEKFNFKFMCFSETWLTPEKCQLYNWNRYTAVQVNTLLVCLLKSLLIT